MSIQFVLIQFQEGRCCFGLCLIIDERYSLRFSAPASGEEVKVTVHWENTYTIEHTYLW